MTIAADSGKSRTLVVDDHGISCSYTVSALRQCSAEVRKAHNAREALAIFRSWRPQLICIDIHLPDSHGLDVIRQIRQDRPGCKSRPRIIIVTGDDSGLRQSDLAVLEIERVLVKPVSAQQLREAAGIQTDNHIGELSPGEHDGELKYLFREELERRLPELDNAISRLERYQASAILHQLIASAAMCSESRLENHLRALDAACREDQSTSDLAQAYYALIESGHEFLCRPGLRKD